MGEPGGGTGGGKSTAAVPNITPQMLGLPAQAKPPELFVDKAAARDVGKQVGSKGEVLNQLGGAVKEINMPMLTFGPLLATLNGAHDGFRDAAGEAILKGRQVLDGWQKALYAAVKNTEAADQGRNPGTGRNGPGLGKVPGNGLGKMPKTDPAKLGGMPKAGGLDPAELKPASMDPFDPAKLGGEKFEPAGMDKDLGAVPPGVDPKGLDPNGLDPNGLDPNGLGQNGMDPKAPNLQTPGMPTPEDTNLSGLGDDPAGLKTPAMPDSRIPGFDTPADDARNLGSGIRPITGTGIPGGGVGGVGGGGGGVGGGAGGAAGGVPGAVRGAGAPGMGGMPFMPFMPPMGGMGMGEQDRGNEGGPSLPEEESTWMGDEDIAPPVIGMDHEDA